MIDRSCRPDNEGDNFDIAESVIGESALQSTCN